MLYNYEFDSDKNTLLQHLRGICFEDIIALIEEGKVLDVIDHPNQEKYSNQRMYIIDVDGYCHMVPFVQDKERIFLKTIIPSREATKKYLDNNKRSK